MRLVLLTAVLVPIALGCANVLGPRDPPATEPAPTSPAPTAPAAAPTEPPAPAPETPAAPTTVKLPNGAPAELTWLEASGDGCVYQRLRIPQGTIEAMFALDVPCDSLQPPVWSPRHDRVALWQTSGERAWELRSADEARVELPRPPQGAVWDTFAYDHDGRLVGLSLTTPMDPTVRELKEGAQTYTAGPEISAPALAHAFTLDAAGQWQPRAVGLVEADLTRVRAPLSAGLPLWTELKQVRYADRVVAELNLDPASGNRILRDATADEASSLGSVSGLDGRWAAADIGHFRLAFHVTEADGALLPEPPFYLWDPKGWRTLDIDMQPPVGQSASWPVLSWSGPWLLACMAPYRVVLIDLRSGAKVWTDAGSFALLQ